MLCMVVGARRVSAGETDARRVGMFSSFRLGMSVGVAV